MLFKNFLYLQFAQLPQILHFTSFSEFSYELFSSTMVRISTKATGGRVHK